MKRVASEPTGDPKVSPHHDRHDLVDDQKCPKNGRESTEGIGRELNVGIPYLFRLMPGRQRTSWTRWSTRHARKR